MRNLTIIFILFIALKSAAQDRNNIVVRFNPTFASKQITLDETYYQLPTGDSLQLGTFRCYISNVTFYNNDRLVFAEKNSFHLIDAADISRLQFNIKTNGQVKFDEIHFNLGIDSLTNVSGAMGGDLDPTKGMYWSWQSGYINLKLEGKSNLCKTRKNEFEFHLGGYAKETKAVTEVKLKTRNSNTVIINIPLDKFLADIDLANTNSIMIPGKEAVALSKKIALLFEVVAE